MGEFSIIHWLIVGIIAVLLFGHRLPSVARSMGKSFSEFKKGLHNIGDDFDISDTSSPQRRVPQSRPAATNAEHDEVSAPKFEPPQRTPDETIKS